MLDQKRLPLSRSQGLAAFILAVSNLAAFAISPSALGGATVLFALLLGWLLVRGSRAGWMLALIGSASGLMVADSPGSIGAAAITIGCLLVPSSVEYTWKRSGAASAGTWTPSRFKRLIELAGQVVYRLVAQAAGWSYDREVLGRSYGLLAWRLGGLALFLLLPLTLIYRWEQASHSPVAGDLVKVTWMSWAIVVVAFLVALMLVAWQHAPGRRRRRSN
jgi:hypothetical protein